MVGDCPEEPEQDISSWDRSQQDCREPGDATPTPHMTSLSGLTSSTPQDASPTSNNHIDLDMAGRARSKTGVSGQPNPSNRRQIWLSDLYDVRFFHHTTLE
jgi:hypothetical protein